MKIKERVLRNNRVKDLRRRWLAHTLTGICSLGLVGVLAATAGFAAHFYNTMESDMRNRAKSATDFFSDCLNQDYDTNYQNCLFYTQSFDNGDSLRLQFLDAEGQIIAASHEGAASAPATQDVSDAMTTRTIGTFVGKDSQGQRIMAVSSPVICNEGQFIGVFRYVTPTTRLDTQILLTAVIGFSLLAVFALVVFLSSNRYIRSILVPLGEIIDKSQKIANGSYGIQIHTKFDDEIGELAKIINELSQKISANEKMQWDFISSISHELRTPLTAITGWSETLLSSDKLDNDTRRGVRIIHRESNRLTDMVLDLLDFARIQDDRMTLNMEMVDIRAEFEDTVFMYGSRLSDEGISLKYADNEQEIPEISCDPQRLRQVFLNILNNALKHGGEGKCIDASIVYQDDYVVVKIRDYGPGIPEDELGLVKKKFYKGSSKARGSGIGLAVSDEIVQMHGGELKLENALTGGTLVTIRLPANQ